jgi:quercetin dioxygenase-like cupin family protein
MHGRWGISAVLVGALVAGASFASDDIDAAAAAPDEFKVLLENDDVRVLEYEIRPGQQDPWHTHPPKVSYVLAGGKLRITPKVGAPFEITETAGEASWLASLGPHRAENVGTTPVRILLVEVKAAAGAAASSAGSRE